MRIARALALPILVAACAAPDAPPPSILLVTLDTTRADRLGAYGSSAGLTPNLDRLAARGTVFEAAIAQAAVTPVSHASILTGLEPYSHGLRVLHGHEHNRLAPERTTLAEILRGEGYATAAVVSAFPAGSYFGLAQGFAVFDEDFAVASGDEAPGSPVSDRGAVNTGLHQRRADLTTDRALAWLEGTAGPWFLWVHYFDPHDPLVLPPEDLLAGLPDPATDERGYLRAVYDREVRFMDGEIGRLLAAVGEETIVAVVADHGEGLGDHGWWTHGILYQEQIRIPLVVPAGRRVGELVRTIDLMPTLLGLAGIAAAAPAELDGADLAPLLAAEAGRGTAGRVAYADSLSTITYRFSPTISDRKDDVHLALVAGGWKYIHHLNRPEESELYELATDPGELHNRLGEEAELAERMRRELERRPLLPATAPTSEPDAADAEAAERLRALGYIN